MLTLPRSNHVLLTPARILLQGLILCCASVSALAQESYGQDIFSENGYGQEHAAQDSYVTAGSAYSLLTNELLYREVFTGLDENKSVRVDYVSPGGNVFASKTLVFQGEPFQPTVDFQDQRDNEFVSAHFQGARLVLTQGTNSSREERIIYDNARVVIDAGLDAYIQLNWDKLLAGKTLKFDYIAPASLRVSQLEVRKIKSTSSPLYNADFGRNWIYFQIKTAKKIPAFFSGAINLAYDPNGKYLMRYHGRANIDDDRGGPWDVRIEYEYLN